MESANNFYESIRNDIVRDASEFYSGAGELISAAFGPDRAQEIQEQSLAHFQEIYKLLPDIGGNLNPLIQTFIYSAISLGFFLAARDNGLEPEEAGKMNYDIIEYYYTADENKGELVQADRASIEEQKKQIQAKSVLPSLPENWVTRLIETDDDQADIAWNNRECAILNLYEKYNAKEYVPFMCMIDAITYPLRGLGLKRTQTLVDADCCDFRVKLGGPTRLEPYAEKLLKKWHKK